MARQLLSTICLAIAMVTTLSASDRVNIITFTDETGKTSYFLVDREALKKCPPWDQQGEPPLSVSRAIAKAKESLKQKFASFNFSKVTDISLGRIWEPDVTNRWYYTVGIEGQAIVDGVETSKRFSVLMLMDGTIVEPSDKRE